ncbi:hypothetical protein VTJ83DRAFT_5975 [Remersonia thermophila]|uniref:C2H2-type domain-containing protein n=1 Tax=Remersonia thermophila TaxID=72144 RepID=A0ABR4D8H9_9PEZI
MSITIDDHTRRRFGSADYHHMSSYSSQPPFSDPWTASSSTSTASHSASQTNGIFAAGTQDAAAAAAAALPHLNMAAIPRHTPSSQHSTHGTHAGVSSSSPSMAQYASIPVSAAPSGVYRQHDLLSVPSDPFTLNRLPQPASSAAYDTAAYTTAGSPVTTSYTPPSPSPYGQLGYATTPLRDAFAMGQDDASRRYSQQSIASAGAEFALPDHARSTLQPDDRRGFRDALEASHGMISMSQDTPRNIYDLRQHRSRGSLDSYGFPSTHSSTSSISSTGFSGYYGSVDGSVSDYSATGSDIECMPGNRTLPRPQPQQPQSHMLSAQPPAPQSMMSSFSSRVSSNTQKKHKCKVCDKRFTRPSSLQTHMYSHTGEKPFGCEVEGCGRRFSVVSNLRRHKKVHSRGGESPSDAGSEEHESP